MTEIQAPTNCPSCNSVLEWSNHLLYCRNPVCDSKVGKRIEHFAKTLKIKGLGPSAIEKLGFEDFYDIYNISVDKMAEALSSRKLAEKLYAEIQNSKNAPLEMVLPAFSIPLIGNTAAIKLSSVCNSITDITTDNCLAAGLGPKATENLMTWLKNDFWSFYDGMLPFSFRFSGSDAKSSPDEIKGIVCISGKLKSFKSKADATKALTDAGYEVKSSLTKQVTILVNESGVESSKTQKARESGVTIITDLKDIIGE